MPRKCEEKREKKEDKYNHEGLGEKKTTEQTYSNKLTIPTIKNLTVEASLCFERLDEEKFSHRIPERKRMTAPSRFQDQDKTASADYALWSRDHRFTISRKSNVSALLVWNPLNTGLVSHQQMHHPSFICLRKPSQPTTVSPLLPSLCMHVMEGHKAMNWILSSPQLFFLYLALKPPPSQMFWQSSSKDIYRYTYIKFNNNAFIWSFPMEWIDSARKKNTSWWLIPKTKQCFPGINMLHGCTSTLPYDNYKGQTSVLEPVLSHAKKDLG